MKTFEFNRSALLVEPRVEIDDSFDRVENSLTDPGRHRRCRRAHGHLPRHRTRRATPQPPRRGAR